MKPVQPIYLRGGGCRVLLCGFSPKYFSMTRHRHFLESTRPCSAFSEMLCPYASRRRWVSAMVAVS